MAFVGTARAAGSPVYTLASILQGEAGGQGALGMQAIANVIQNRASSNFLGYGNSIMSQMTAKMQFQGQAVPGEQALQIAQQAVDGNLIDVTGGATSYANPAASSASWARNLSLSNSMKIGDHFFTDNTNGVGSQAGQSLDSYQPPMFKDAALQDAASSSASDPHFSEFYGSNFNMGDTSAADTSSSGVGNVASGLDPNSGFSSQSIDFSTVGDSAAQTSGTVADAQTVPWAIDQQTQQQAASANAVAKATVQGAGVEAQGEIKGAQTVAQGATSDTNAQLQSTQSWIGNIENWFTSLFSRFGFVLLGLVFVGAALYMLASRQGMLPKTIAAGAPS